ncbi:sugar kinase [Gracilibacillus alcaliphilus]|uniref:sugar kinase n=1 Tax=Gracilibacillus alcaliphilus TaxID=1401441 RepID=UPI00195E0F5A|nr:sugar kinase [Gracilibacillus alcaliphilus]MBM7675503.1 2-dehydro-3-deoxygluconokinase [Gracilibacillus alcaliphilus]
MPKTIAAFGEVMMRLEVPGHDLLTQASQLNYSFSGTGVNIAGSLRRLGYSTKLITTLPNNSLGDAALSYLQKLGISTGDISRSGKYLGMYFLENGFGARPSRVTYSNRIESSFNTADTANYDFVKMAQDIQLLHVCGITLAMNAQVRSQLKQLTRLVKENGGMILFDCNYRPALWGESGYQQAKPHYEELFKLADMVMMNEKDALYILGYPSAHTTREKQLEELIPKIADTYDISCIAGTHRDVHGDESHSIRGFLYQDTTFSYASQQHFAVLDRIGAGDAFTTGIIHGLLQSYPAEQTIQFAVASSMLAHTISGDTSLASEADIQQAVTAQRQDVIR